MNSASTYHVIYQRAALVNQNGIFVRVDRRFATIYELEIQCDNAVLIKQTALKAIREKHPDWEGSEITSIELVRKAEGKTS